MTLPGPGAAALFVDLLFLAAVAGAIGEPIRSLLARRSPWLAGVDPIERGLVDLYLGGALVYGIAAVPIGAFTPVVLVAAPVLVWALRIAVGPAVAPAIRSAGASIATALASWPYAVALGTFLGLLAVEVAAAAPVPTGNTYDSSLYGLYTSLLLLHHTLPLSLAPVDGVGVAFPQGATAWFGFGQGVLGLPAVRTSLLITPLFLALGAPAGFVLGRRWWGTPGAGAAVALVFGLLGPFPRDLVTGSNDLVLSLPLVFLLAAFARGWSSDSPPTWGDALVFGGLAGYAAALSPVGPEWLFGVVLVSSALATPRWGGRPWSWLLRYGAALAVGLAFVVPSLSVLVSGRSSPGLVPGGAAIAAGTPFGTSVAQFVGEIDPFLFRASDTWLSPFPLLRAELALLIAGGAALLVLGAYGLVKVSGPFARFVVSGGIVAALILGGFVVATHHTPGFSDLVYATSATETSVLLFVVYTLVASVPAILLLERFPWIRPILRRDATTGAPRVRLGLSSRSAATILLAIAILVPGVGVTAVSLPVQLQTIYERYSNVTVDDLALLQFAAGTVPNGARILVAPGSAAEFLPEYDPRVVVLYPMVANFGNINASYTLVVQELTNGTLDAPGTAALAQLEVGYIAVTGASNDLFAAFAPGPIQADPAYEVVFHQGDAWLFAASPG